MTSMISSVEGKPFGLLPKPFINECSRMTLFVRFSRLPIWRNYALGKACLFPCCLEDALRTRAKTSKPRTLCAKISETVLVLLINEQGEKEKGRDEREFSWCCSFPWGFGCRGTERRRA